MATRERFDLEEGEGERNMGQGIFFWGQVLKCIGPFGKFNLYVAYVLEIRVMIQFISLKKRNMKNEKRQKTTEFRDGELDDWCAYHNIDQSIRREFEKKMSSF